jgi:acyl-CoA thioesterase FadM
MQSLAMELGGSSKAQDMIAGKGVSLILGEINIKFRRPIVYPDTVRYHKQHMTSGLTTRTLLFM